MPKKRNFQTRPVGLTNDSQLENEHVNHEEARVEAVKEVLSIKPNMPMEDVSVPDGIQVRVLIERLNVRETPSTSGKILFPVKKDDILLTDSLHGDWLAIRTTGENPVKGFVVAKYVEEVVHGQHS